ncbi:hypothetical protein [Shouchella lonarensis]|uniref:Uncharacterized protein n=1 Tax=Shouchella lonarensis TaxID=1464122 RepID=A0A1G6IM08_9BACI|nr:hypothetical protein [Shouchella lonarensis]SDC06786.1 hypothetical protein SAMN05421737_10589 [Shouchella lonarensis]
MDSKPKYDYDPEKAIEKLETAYKQFDEMIKLDMFTPHMVESAKEAGIEPPRVLLDIDAMAAEFNHDVVNFVENAKIKIRAKQKELREYLANESD